MAKINSTFGAGYFIPEDYDYRRLPKSEDQLRRDAERQSRRDAKHKRGRDAAGPSAADATEPASSDAQAAAPAAGSSWASRKTRQTWMVEFDTICDRCERTIPRGTKLYANVEKLRERYLGRVERYSLTIRCPKCGLGEVVFHTCAPEDGKYLVVSGGRKAAGGDRTGGDYAAAQVAPAADESATTTGAQGTVDAAQDELTARIEKHQQAAMEAEAVDDAFNDELERVFFPASDLLAAVRRGHEEDAAAREAAAEQAREQQMSAADRLELRERFERLRAERGLPPSDAKAAASAAALREAMGAGGSAATGASGLALLELDDALLKRHNDMVREAAAVAPQPAATATRDRNDSAHNTAPSAATAKKPSKLLAGLFD